VLREEDELERALPRALPPRVVVRLLRALLPRDVPPLRELEDRDSFERLRVLARPLLDARPRVEVDFFFAADCRPPDFFAADREVPLEELARRDPLDCELLSPLPEVCDELREPDERDDDAPLRRDPDPLPLRDPAPLPPLARDFPREPPRPELFSSAACAVSRLTILLKLLRWPSAVVS
jgi:hypothetical protein